MHFLASDEVLLSVKLDQNILTLLFAQLRAQSPWINSEELRDRLRESGVEISKEILSAEIQRLTKQGYLELQSVDSTSLARGYITRLTVPGRNKWVHGHSLTGE